MFFIEEQNDLRLFFLHLYMINITAYDTSWPKIFNELKNIYLQLLSDDIVSVEHVGSTAVPGLYAKPVLDIDIIISNKSILQNIIYKLESVGYIYRGELGIEDRFAFSQAKDEVPYNTSTKSWMKHNLYVCIEGSLSLRNHLLLKDYLLQNSEKVEEYSMLKQKLALQYIDDIDNYVKYKTPFIVDILEKQGVEKSAIDQIKNANGYDR